MTKFDSSHDNTMVELDELQRTTYESDQVVIPYDENLLERTRIQWQFGDWQSLAYIERDVLQHHPDRAKLAILVAAGLLQTGQVAEARQFIRLAQDWGCSKKIISQILIAGVHNSIGRAAAICSLQSCALQHFENAINIGTPGSDIHLVTGARAREQIAQIGTHDNNFLKSIRISEQPEANISHEFRNRNNQNGQIEEFAKGILGFLFMFFANNGVRFAEILYRNKQLTTMGSDSIHQPSTGYDLLEVFENQPMDELVKNIKITLHTKRGRVTYNPQKFPVYAPDESLIAGLCDNVNEELKKGQISYMRGNYPRVAEDARVISNFITDKYCSILDVGSVPPLLTALLVNDGYKNITVIDPSVEIYSQYFKSANVKAIKRSVFDLDDVEEVKEYSLVTFCEVIEHLSGDLRVAIEAITRFVKAEGLLLLTTPNLRSIPGYLGLAGFQSGLASKYKETVRAQYDRKDRDGFYGHLREFTVKEIVDLMASYGFQHVKSFYQPDYRNPTDPVSKLSSVFELAFPDLRLFGRHLFKKTL